MELFDVKKYSKSEWKNRYINEAVNYYIRQGLDKKFIEDYQYEIIESYRHQQTLKFLVEWISFEKMMDERLVYSEVKYLHDKGIFKTKEAIDTITEKRKDYIIETYDYVYSDPCHLIMYTIKDGEDTIMKGEMVRTDDEIDKMESNEEQCESILDDYTKNHVKNNMKYYINKPSIMNTSKLLQKIVYEIINSESGMYFVDRDNIDDIKGYLERENLNCFKELVIEKSFAQLKEEIIKYDIDCVLEIGSLDMIEQYDVIIGYTSLPESFDLNDTLDIEFAMIEKRLEDQERQRSEIKEMVM